MSRLLQSAKLLRADALRVSLCAATGGMLNEAEIDLVVAAVGAGEIQQEKLEAAIAEAASRAVTRIAAAFAEIPTTRQSRRRVTPTRRRIARRTARLQHSA